MCSRAIFTKMERKEENHLAQPAEINRSRFARLFSRLAMRSAGTINLGLWLPLCSRGAHASKRESPLTLLGQVSVPLLRPSKMYEKPNLFRISLCFVT